MNLYNRKSLITAAPEGKPVTSYKPNVTKWVYFMLVILLAAYLIYLLIKPYYLVEAQGLVDVEVRDVPVGAMDSRWLLRMPCLRMLFCSAAGKRLAKVPGVR